MLSREQQREILGLGLLALAVFSLLSLVPVSILGSGVAGSFPSGNTMGSVGAWVRRASMGALGIGAVCLPLLLAVWGSRSLGWITLEWSVRLAVLAAGVMLLVPLALFVAEAEIALVGSVAEVLGRPLVAFFGWLGASLVLTVLFLLLLVGTLGWNPLRPLTRVLVAGGAATGRGAVAASRGAKGWVAGLSRRLAEARAARQERKQATAVEAPVESGGEAEDDLPWDEAPTLEEEPRDEPEEEVAQEDVAQEEPRPEAGSMEERLDLGEHRPMGGEELPSLDLLTPPDDAGAEGMDTQLDRLGEVLVEKLQTFNVESELGGRTTGPTVTQFEVIPAPGVKVSRIANLDADLALAMKARSIRIVAPIPGKGAVGVEIPNPAPEVVNLREILDSPAYGRSRATMPMALGKDLTGDPYVADLTRMPHLLIAGATGSGKSVCLNTIITSLIYRHTPETLRLLMIDPKMVELSAYKDLPHLRHNVVTDPHDAAGVLRWAVIEMERRYNLLQANTVRSVAEFNRKLKEGAIMRRAEASGDEGDPDRWIYDDGVLPYVVLVVDELADLMMTVQSDVEKPLTQLAQKARAIGVHLIVATQRPSVNVITGLIKANFPARIAFRVASKTDSRTILDQNGADALLGNGDMLFLPPGQNEPLRMQGAFISTGDTEKLMAWYREQAELSLREAEAEEAAREEEDILEFVRSQESQEVTDAALEEDLAERDELFRAAAEVCIQYEQGSTSLLQRRLRVGYGRAARIVDQLHEAGILGAPDGSKPRELLVGMEELDRICENLP